MLTSDSRPVLWTEAMLMWCDDEVARCLPSAMRKAARVGGCGLLMRRDMRVDGGLFALLLLLLSMPRDCERRDEVRRRW